MKKLIVLAIVAVAVLSTPASAADRKGGNRGEARLQVAFGIRVAQQGLWREATYRWERAAELDPTYAAAFNNLAVAYEQAGLLDKAKQAYQKAAELDPKNSSIKQNIELFKEINDRASSKTPQ